MFNPKVPAFAGSGAPFFAPQPAVMHPVFCARRAGIPNSTRGFRDYSIINGRGGVGTVFAGDSAFFAHPIPLTPAREFRDDAMQSQAFLAAAKGLFHYNKLNSFTWAPKTDDRDNIKLKILKNRISDTKSAGETATHNLKKWKKMRLDMQIDLGKEEEV